MSIENNNTPEKCKEVNSKPFMENGKCIYCFGFGKMKFYVMEN